MMTATTIRAVCILIASGLVIPAGAITPQIAAGCKFSMALRSDGTVLTWGENRLGQLGHGTANGNAVPGKVPINGRVSAIAAGCSYALALKEDGTIVSWGANGMGMLGDGTTSPRSSPVDVVGIPGRVIAISASQFRSAAITEDGSLWVWGNYDDFPIGEGLLTNKTVRPIKEDSLKAPLVAIALGYQHLVAIDREGSVIAWGVNSNGQLGPALTRLPRSSPAPVSGLEPGFVAVAAGRAHTLALRRDGTALGWGYNSYGQLGIGSDSIEVRRFDPSALKLSNLVAVSAGQFHSLALRSDGTVFQFGGMSDRWPDPREVDGLSAIVAISAGSDHSMALAKDGTVYTWGSGKSGQLGSCTTEPQPGGICRLADTDPSRPLRLGNTQRDIRGDDR